MIIKKSPQEIAKMGRAGEILVAALRMLEGKIRPGVSTGELDAAAERFIRSRGAAPTFKGYRGFPGSICASPNAMIVHGIPGPYRLRDGDIVSIDVGVTLDGFYTVLKNIVSQGLVTDPTSGQPIWIIQQNPEVRSYGLELEAEGRLPNTGFGAVTNWTWLRAEFASCPPPNFCGSGADVGTLIAGVPPIVGNLALTYGGRSGVNLDADWHFVDRRCAGNGNCSNQLPTYTYLNLGAQYLIPESGVTIRADVLNVYQSKGLEEGNPRLSLLPNGRTSSLFLARPIPRALMVSLGYKF